MQLDSSEQHVLQAIRDAKVSVLLPIPQDAKLRLDYSSRLSFWHLPMSTKEVDLSEFDYVSVAPQHLFEVINNPDALSYCIDTLLKLDREDGKFTLQSIRDSLDWRYSIGYLVDYIKQYLVTKHPISLRHSGRVLAAHLDAIRDRFTYPLDYDNAGDFRKSKVTTQAIIDMNVAFHLFRIEKPLDPKKETAFETIEGWLHNRWNASDRTAADKRAERSVGTAQINMAARVILDTSSTPTIGTFDIPEMVREQHHAEAPEALMFMEYLALRKDQASNSKDLESGLDFRQSSTLEGSLLNKGVKPSTYCRLLTRVLSMY